MYVYSNTNNYYWAKRITYTYSFHTYLDYCPPGSGLHIELAEADWTVQVTAHFSGPGGDPLLTYNNPDYWFFDVNSVTGPTYSYNRQIITWSINTQDAQAKYAW